MSIITIQYTAVMSAVSGNVAAGDVLTKYSDGLTWVVASSGNFTSALSQVWAVALAAGTSSQPVPIQYVGEVTASVSGLAAGTASYVRVSSAGRIERVGAIDAKTIGKCDTYGNVILITGLGIAASSNIASILDYGALGNGTTDDSAAITAATAAMTSGVLYFPAGTYKLSNNCTTPSGVELWFAPGAVLSPDSGKVCTLTNTMIRANPNQQIFTTGAGTFAFSVTSGSPPVPEVHAGWFGAKGDCNGSSGNGTDCTAAIQAAIDMAATYSYTARGYKSGRVLLPRGILRITDSLIIDADRANANAFGMYFAGAATGPATITDTTIFWDGTTTTYTDVNVTATTSTSLTITSASASFAANIVGSVVYLSGCATAGNNGAYPVKTRVSGTSIVLDTTYMDVTQAAPDANNGSITIALPTKPALKVWSNNNVLENFAITVCPSKYLLCGIDHTEGSAGAVNTYNQFRNIRVDTDNRSQAILLVGLKHADNTTNPGNAPWPNDCENSIFSNCSFARAQLAPVYCPSQGGQAKKILFENCNIGNASSSGIQNSRWGIFWYSGGFVLRGCAWGYCDTGVVGLSCEQFEIEDGNLESCGRLARVGNNTTGGQMALFSGGRYSINGLHSDGKFVQFYGAGTLVLLRTFFDATYSASFLIDANNVEDGTQRSANVTAIGCIFPNNAPFATAPAGSGYLRTLLGCANVRTGASGTYEPMPNEFQKPFVNAITYAEKTYVDTNGLVVNGYMATRRAGVTLANGANNDIALGGASFIRCTGPTGAFSISGFAGGVDGRRLTVYNTTSQTMTITNDATSTAANRIITCTGADVVLRATLPSCANFVYDGSGSRWILISIN